mgnify:CR=1 FL=1
MTVTIGIDIETYSSIDLTSCGVYAYTSVPDFEVLLFGFTVDDGPAQVVDLAQGEALPEFLVESLTDPAVLKTAYNANFERTCLAKHFGKPMPPEQWQCSSAHALTLGLPGYLDGVAKVLKLQQQKDSAGKALIRYFCVPCKPTKSNGGRTRNLPEHAPEKWEKFKAYCIQDVEVERDLRYKLSRYPLSKQEQRLWELDQKINDAGVLVDRQLVENAITCDKSYYMKSFKEAQALTGLENPNSVAQLKGWIDKTTGKTIKSLNKEKVKELLEDTECETLKPVLELRQKMSKTSIKKYQAMERAVCSDGRVRGLFQFYGANRTGRWCLTGDHEILTKDGWKRLDVWDGGEIACWNPNGEIVSFQKAERVQFEYEGDMYHYCDKRISQISTPDHKMYVKRQYGGSWLVDTVENMSAYRPSIPVTGSRSTNRGLEHNYLRVLVMIQGDGHYTSDGSIRLKFVKKRKVERCRSLLRKADILYNETKQKAGNKTATLFTIYSRHVPLWLRLFHNKTFGPWLLDESPDVFFDEIANWDGYYSAKNSIQYSTTNKQNADMVQAFAHLSGRNALVRTKDRGEQNLNWNTSYVVNIWLNPKNCHEIKPKPRVFHYKGRVYCAVTPTGFFLVRRDGKVWVTGNSGRLVQVQNLPRSSISDLDVARQLLKAGEFEVLELFYDSVPRVLSELIRTALIPSSGCRFIVSDFSAIEARVIAWLAGEQWRMEVFRGHGKIYEASASQMFKVPFEEITKDNPLRQKGKIAELALGYGGAAGALKAMGALEKGLKEEELPELVDTWRAANPAIVQFWWDVGNAAMEAVKNKTTVQVHHGIEFSYESGGLFLRLPSGRRLCYIQPKIELDKQFNKPTITYAGAEQGKSWGRINTYGPKLVENMVQATARDCLAESMLRLAETGYKIVMHVHDEVILEMPEGQGSAEKACEIMAQPLKWAPGLPLPADGFETNFYKKD